MYLVNVALLLTSLYKNKSYFMSPILCFVWKNPDLQSNYNCQINVMK